MGGHTQGSSEPAQGAFDLSIRAQDVGAAERPERHGGLEGNGISAGLGALLASFGVAEARERDVVGEVVERELRERGHQARVVRLRYSTLHLEAGAQCARLLRYDVPALLEALAVAAPGQVEQISVRVAR